MTKQSPGDKVLVSVIMGLFAAFTLIAAAVTFDGRWLVLGAICVLVAVSPWADPNRPTRLGAFILLGFAAVFAYPGLRILAGSISFPRECVGKGRHLCELENFLFGIGGYPAASIPWLAVALGFACFWIRVRRQSKAPPEPS